MHALSCTLARADLWTIDVLFVIGGHEELRHAETIRRACESNRVRCAIIAIPKSIDNGAWGCVLVAGKGQLDLLAPWAVSPPTPRTQLPSLPPDTPPPLPSLQTLTQTSSSLTRRLASPLPWRRRRRRCWRQRHARAQMRVCMSRRAPACACPHPTTRARMRAHVGRWRQAARTAAWGWSSSLAAGECACVGARCGGGGRGGACGWQAGVSAHPFTATVCAQVWLHRRQGRAGIGACGCGAHSRGGWVGGWVGGW